MNEFEKQIAESVRDAVNVFSTTSERAEQDKQWIIGPSAIGFCSERLRRQLDRQEPQDEVQWNKTFIGTFLGDGLEQAWKKANPRLLIQQEFKVTLEGDERTFVIPAHSDVIDQDEGIVWDFKTKDGLQYVSREKQPSQGYQYQRHLYGLGAHQSGLFPNHALEDLRVGNIYYDRSGREPVPYVQVEPYSPDVVREAVWWLEEAVSAFLAGEEATKEPPREMCAATCGFFTVCRGHDTDVEGRITDPRALGAIDMYVEAGELERQAKKMKDEAKTMLVNVEGNTATHTLRWNLVNGGEVSYFREPQLRMSLTKNKK